MALQVINEEELIERYKSKEVFSKSLSMFVEKIKERVVKQVYEDPNRSMEEQLAPIMLYLLVSDVTEEGIPAIRIVASDIDVDMFVRNERLAVAGTGALLINQAEMMIDDPEIVKQIPGQDSKDARFTEKSRIMGVMLQSVMTEYTGEAAEGVDAATVTDPNKMEGLQERDILMFSIDLPIGTVLFNYQINEVDGRRIVATKQDEINTLLNPHLSKGRGSANLLTASMEVYHIADLMAGISTEDGDDDDEDDPLNPFKD